MWSKMFRVGSIDILFHSVRSIVPRFYSLVLFLAIPVIRMVLSFGFVTMLYFYECCIFLNIFVFYVDSSLSNIVRFISFGSEAVCFQIRC